MLVVVRAVLSGLFAGNQRFDWHFTVGFTAIIGTVWFCVQFVYTCYRFFATAPTEAILTSVQTNGNTANRLAGFVAMEYYCLMLNRTFVIFIAPEALYGWKAEGIVTNMQPTYFQAYAQMLKDPSLMDNREAVQKLAGLKGGFVIPRSQIKAAELVQGNKSGMGGIPHTGRICIHLTSGRNREFILLGSVDAERIRQEILSGAPVQEQ
jgi:hypothetical protein